jgi:hypothetical protein
MAGTRSKKEAPKTAGKDVGCEDLEAKTEEHHRGVLHHHGVLAVAPKWGETPEELRRSLNFETPDDEDPHGNKQIFANSYDKVYAVVDKATGEYQECADMSECDLSVHWNEKLKGVTMHAMVFEGKNSLIDYSAKIKASKPASNPSVSCQP